MYFFYLMAFVVLGVMYPTVANAVFAVVVSWYLFKLYRWFRKPVAQPQQVVQASSNGGNQAQSQKEHIARKSPAPNPADDPSNTEAPKNDLTDDIMFIEAQRAMNRD